MISSLEELIAPLTPAEFAAILRARTLTFRRGSGANRFAELLDWSSFRRVIESDVIPAKILSLTKNRRPVAPLFYRDLGKINPKKLASLLNKGASVIVHDLNPYVPALDALCANIRAHFAEKIRAGAILTTGAGGALVPHYDPEDLIILQIEGTKRWRIHGSPKVNPILGAPMEETAPQGAPTFDEIVQPGDFLFVPAGYWHVCENGPGQSLHLAIFFVPPSGWHAVEALLRRLLDDDLFRVPLTRFHAPAEEAAHEVALKASLIDKIRQVSFTELLTDAPPAKTVSDPYHEVKNVAKV